MSKSGETVAVSQNGEPSCSNAAAIELSVTIGENGEKIYVLRNPSTSTQSLKPIMPGNGVQQATEGVSQQSPEVRQQEVANSSSNPCVKLDNRACDIPSSIDELMTVSAKNPQAEVKIVKKEQKRLPNKRKRTKVVNLVIQKVKNAEVDLSEPIPTVNEPLFPNWSLTDDQWDQMKESMKHFMKNTPYDPKKSFADMVKEYVEYRNKLHTVTLLPREFKPDNISEDSTYGICCVMPTCDNVYYRKGSNWEEITSQKSFFSVPADRKMALNWLVSFNKPLLKSIPHEELMTYRVCEDHFDLDDFEGTDENKVDLLVSAVPKRTGKSRRRRKMKYYVPTLEEIEERKEMVKRNEELGIKQKRRLYRRRHGLSEPFSQKDKEKTNADDALDPEENIAKEVVVQRLDGNEDAQPDKPNIINFGEDVVFMPDVTNEIVIDEEI